MDYTALTDAVNFANVASAILAVATALAGIYVGIRGAKIILAFLRSR